MGALSVNFTPATAQDFVAPQEPAVEPEAPAANPKLAYVRTWFMARPPAPVELVARIGDAAEEVLVAKPNAYFYCGYREIKPGSAQIGVYPLGDRSKPVASMGARLRQGRFYTVLVRPGSTSGDYKMEWMDDSLSDLPPDLPADAEPEAKGPIRHRIRLYQFLEGQSVDLSIQAVGYNEKLQPGDTRVLDVESPQALVIEFQTQDAAGKDIIGETDANLKETPSISLLILRDLYGRFSPRVIGNGTLD